jgi:O-antigen ligase
MLLCYVVPTVAVVALIILGLAQSEISFGRSSLAAASGGFGPNQISAALGLASLCCFLVAVNRSVPMLLRLIIGLAIIAFAAQSALTFSRCGLYYFVGGALLATFLMMRNPQMAVQIGLLMAVLAAVVYFVVYPWLDGFTNGALSERFKNTDLTNRDKIMAMDLKIFQENIVLGIGVGRAKEAREAMEHRASSHTEYTRLLAEHGSLGVGAILLLFGMGFLHFWKPRTVPGRAFSAAMVTYTMMYMTGNGMRQVLPALTFGMAACTVLAAPPRRPVNVTPMPSAATEGQGPEPGPV